MNIDQPIRRLCRILKHTDDSVSHVRQRGRAELYVASVVQDCATLSEIQDEAFAQTPVQEETVRDASPRRLYAMETRSQA